MALLDLLGRRWTLRVIWELRDGPLVFRALQERCEAMSSSVLNQRLRELAQAGITQSGAAGYELTDSGRELLDTFAPLNAWAERCGGGRTLEQDRHGPVVDELDRMCAPKRPRRAPASSQKRSYSGCACSPGAASMKLGRLPRRASP